MAGTFVDDICGVTLGLRHCSYLLGVEKTTIATHKPRVLLFGRRLFLMYVITVSHQAVVI